jgi:hypothetical protein
LGDAEQCAGPTAGCWRADDRPENARGCASVKAIEQPMA